jgi:excisionase family DNA binding protein
MTEVHRMTKVATSGEWVCIEELAAELGIPVRTIYSWRTLGRGPRGYRIGRHVRFRRRDVEHWLETLADPKDAA